MLWIVTENIIKWKWERLVQTKTMQNLLEMSGKYSEILSIWKC